MKKFVSKKIMFTGILALLSINSYGEFKSIEEDKFSTKEILRISNKLREEDYLNRDLRRDKKMYIVGDTTPFTGTLVLRLGDYVEYTEMYENGILQGDKTWYDSKGNIMMIETYVNGKINGEQITYYSNSKVRSIVTYKENKIMVTEWYKPDGKPLYREDFTDGEGEWINFWDNGTIHESGRYLNFSKQGEWKTYSERGDLLETKVYDKGRLISTTYSN